MPSPPNPGKERDGGCAWDEEKCFPSNRASNVSVDGGGGRLNASNVTSAATVGDLTAEEKREGDEDVGSLPRTLSTSVLRIKHRRSFWEKVVGYVFGLLGNRCVLLFQLRVEELRFYRVVV